MKITRVTIMRFFASFRSRTVSSGHFEMSSLFSSLSAVFFLFATDFCASLFRAVKRLATAPITTAMTVAYIGIAIFENASAMFSWVNGLSPRLYIETQKYISSIPDTASITDKSVLYAVRMIFFVFLVICVILSVIYTSLPYIII